MSPPPQRPIRLELDISASHPALLEGLDTWLRLGLISDVQVRQICRLYLTCLVREPASVVTPTQSKTEQTEPASRPTPPKRPSFSTQVIHSLMAELSVIWLLFLGVFLVVVSSALLAASQWDRFPAAGQYGVLFAYTLVFWFVSLWVNRQPNLHLTAKSLQIVTLLLVPVNFWAMDGFKLWSSPLEWITVAVATVALTGMTRSLLKSFPKPSNWDFINIAGLSYLHWGWQVPVVPLIAVYSGTLLTTLRVLLETRKTKNISTNTTQETPQLTQKIQKFVPATVALYALFVLLFRAIFVAGIEVTQLGLAVGLCGWLVAWLAPSRSKQTPLTSLWYGTATVLLISGWLMSVVEQPAQALGVSLLGVWLLAKNLCRHWQKADLAGIYLIGIQILWLMGRIIPPNIRTTVITTGTEIAKAQDAPGSLLGITWFPYLVLMLFLNGWLYRRQKTELAKFGDQFALIFGVFLTALSVLVPSTRSLNLLASTLVLIWITQQRLPIKKDLVYFTHLTGLFAITSFIHWVLPNLTQGQWGAILVGLTLLEWASLTVFQSNTPHLFQRFWLQSAWYYGLGLAGLSYSLFWNHYWYQATDSISLITLESHLMWLLTPIALTFVAFRNSNLREFAGWLSVLGLIMAQILLWNHPESRLIGLGTATLLMIVNTNLLKQSFAGILTVGSGISFVYLLLWQQTFGIQLTLNTWLILNAGTVFAFWLIWYRLKTPSSENHSPETDNRATHRTLLREIYNVASDFWATLLCWLELLALTLHSLGVYAFPHEFEPLFSFQFSLPILIATSIIMGALIFRGWHETTNRNWVIYTFAWGLEIFAAETLGFFGESRLTLSIVNIALGLTLQLAGDWWQRKRGTSATYPSSLHIIPLLYGSLGTLLRWGTLADWTGLTSLGLALIAVGVGRRHQALKPLAYLGFAGITLSAGEIVFYQVQNLAEGDQLIAFATLCTTLIYFYRFLTPWLMAYSHLSYSELKTISHLHWAAGSLFLLSAITYPITITDYVGLGTGIVLTQYAIMQGRNHPSLHRAETWVYAGILEGVGIGLFMVSKLQLATILMPWSAALVAVLAYFFHALPWQSWGWPKRPWLRAAVVLPILAAFSTANAINSISLLIVAAFYIFLAIFNRQIRLSYLSLIFINWAILRWLITVGIYNPLAFVTPPSLSLLYIAQIDSKLQQPEQRFSRHLFRLLAISAIAFVALLTSNGITTGAICLVTVFLGLGLRIRAFLYIGTIVFLLNATNQLILLSFEYARLKMIIGLIAGILLIWIAATFETRREQITQFVQHWIAELEQWE
jgi:hypothetical protein